MIEERSDLDLKLIVQPGTGKGDAVRAGFNVASGDVLMILDADLTVPPEELTKFWRALDTASWAAPLRQRFWLIQRLVLEPSNEG